MRNDTDGDVVIFVCDTEADSIIKLVVNDTQTKEVRTDKPSAIDYDSVEEQFYFIQLSPPSIKRMDINGENVITVFTLPGDAYSLAIDKDSRRLFCAGYANHDILSMDLTGSNPVTVFDSQTVSSPDQIIVHERQRRIIWSDGKDGAKISSSNYDGSDIKKIVNTSVISYGLALDKENDILYWTERSPSVIRAISLDGSNRTEIYRHDSRNLYSIFLLESMLYFSGNEFRVHRIPAHGGVSEEIPSKTIFKTPVGLYVHSETPNRTDGDVVIFVCDTEADSIIKLVVNDTQTKEVRTGKPSAIDYDSVEDQFYFIQLSPPSIKRTDINGENVTTVFNLPGDAYSLAIDEDSRRLFYAGYANHDIVSIDLTGSNPVTVFDSQTVSFPDQIIIHDIQRRITWSDGKDGAKISSSNYDGSDIKKIVDTSEVSYGLALDKDNDVLYWTDYPPSLIWSIALDGPSNRQQIYRGDRFREIYNIFLLQTTLYFTGSNSRVRRIPLDGGFAEVILSRTIFVKPVGLYVFAKTSSAPNSTDQNATTTGVATQSMSTESTTELMKYLTTQVTNDLYTKDTTDPTTEITVDRTTVATSKPSEKASTETTEEPNTDKTIRVTTIVYPTEGTSKPLAELQTYSTTEVESTLTKGATTQVEWTRTRETTNQVQSTMTPRNDVTMTSTPTGQSKTDFETLNALSVVFAIVAFAIIMAVIFFIAIKFGKSNYQMKDACRETSGHADQGHINSLYEETSFWKDSENII